MKIVELRYVNNKVCPYGYALLSDDIPMGTVYRVDVHSLGPGTLRCGGCGQTLSVLLINASGFRHPDDPFLPLPLDIFFSEGELNEALP